MKTILYIFVGLSIVSIVAIVFYAIATCTIGDYLAAAVMLTLLILLCKEIGEYVITRINKTK